MKKILVVALMIAVMTIAGCGASGSSTPSNVSESTPAEAETVKEEVEAPAPEEEISEVFESTEDLTVSFAYSYDRSTYCVVENTGDRPILDYRVAFTEFDNNGFSVTSDGYETGRVEAANLMPGDKDICSFYGSEGKYVVATVVYVKYQGGEEWEAVAVDTWADSVMAGFTVEEHKNAFAQLEEKAIAAETNPYVEIVSTNKKHTNQFSTQDDFNFTLKNISDKAISEIKIHVLEYDENNFAVSTSPYDAYCKNDRSVGGTINLTSGSTDEFGSSLFFEASCSKYKCIVSKIVFTDGEEWENPNLYEWIQYNCEEYK